MPGSQGSRKPAKGFIQEAAILDEITLVAEGKGKERRKASESLTAGVKDADKAGQ